MKVDGNVIESRSYDNGSRLQQIAHGNGLTTGFTYQADNRVTNIDVSTVEGLDFTYTYDANKNKLSEVSNGPMAGYGFSTPSTYDDENRLTNWTRADGQKSQAWYLTAVGDWTTFTENGTPQSRTHGPTHELLSVNGTAVLHDAKGNLTQDQTGQTYVWDENNHLKQVTNSLGTSNYTYDALHRRVSRAVTANGQTTTEVFVGPNWQTIATYGAGQPASTPQETRCGADIALDVWVAEQQEA